MKIFFLLLILGKLLLEQLNLFKSVTISGLFLDLLIIFLLFLLPLCAGYSKNGIHLGYHITSVFIGLILLACTIYERHTGAVLTEYFVSITDQTGELQTTIQSLFHLTDWLFVIDSILLPFTILYTLKKSKENKRNVVLPL